MTNQSQSAGSITQEVKSRGKPNYTIKPYAIENAFGDYCFALHAKGFDISDPFTSECGRFPVESFECYGITHEDALQLKDLNWRLGEILYGIADQVAKAYQVPFGVIDGGLAGMYFSSQKNKKLLHRMMIELICKEFEYEIQFKQDEEAKNHFNFGSAHLL